MLGARLRCGRAGARTADAMKRKRCGQQDNAQAGFLLGRSNFGLSRQEPLPPPRPRNRHTRQNNPRGSEHLCSVLSLEPTSRWATNVATRSSSHYINLATLQPVDAADDL